MRKRQHRGEVRVRSSAEVAGAPSLRDVREDFAILSEAVGELASAVRSVMRTVTRDAAVDVRLSDLAILQRMTEVMRSPTLVEAMRATFKAGGG
ncbi:MAG TPA: hypothetical protein VF495_22685 [Phenylobacterium sp.]